MEKSVVGSSQQVICVILFVLFSICHFPFFIFYF